MPNILRRLRYLIAQRRAVRDLAEELEFHRDMTQRALESEGVSPADARVMARRALGNTTIAREDARAVWIWPWLESVWQDGAYALRGLRRQPGFTLIALMTLALGIGANSAMFSLVDAFVLRSLPVPDPGGLVFVKTAAPNGRLTGGFTYPVFEQFRDRAQTLAGILASDNTRVSVTLEAGAEMVGGEFVSGGYFSTLGVGALIGRTFSTDDDRPGHEPIAVLSYGYWERRFERSPAVMGRKLFVGNVPVTVIGVMPPEFHGLNVAEKSADVILPMFLHGELALRDHDRFDLVARLKPGVAADQARADLDLVFRQTLDPAIAQPRTPRIELTSAARGFSDADDTLSRELRLLLAVVGVVLLIASVNVANLLLARGAARHRELAARVALGASRGRLVRQMMTESLLLAALGGVCGLVLAKWSIGLLLGVLSYGQDPIPFELQADPRLFVFTALASLATGVVFGIVPALRATRVDANPILQGGGADAGSRSPRLGRPLLIAQFALSMMLIIAAGLLVRSLGRLNTVDTGFDRDHVLTMMTYPVLLGYADGSELQLYRSLTDRLESIPGVHSASVSRYTITNGKGANFVGPRYFETLGVRLVQGREFSPADTVTAPRVAIVSERAARDFYPDEPAIGRPVPPEFETLFGGPARIVGVVGDIKHALRASQPARDVYLPYTQMSSQRLGQAVILVRANGEPTALVPSIRRNVEGLDRHLALLDVETLADSLEGFIGGQRSLATLLTAFAGLALLLASVGLYGTTAYTVTERTKEIGIRIALGARRSEIIAIVLRETAVLVGVGAIAGLAASAIATRLIATMLFGIATTDPAAIAVGLIVMMTAAFAAAWVPARRATKVSPLAALRHE